MVTIKDISQKCGVSTSTVSKVLNGYGEIGKETSELVRRTAAEMGYLPNSAARMLKTNRSHNLGVLFVDKMQSGLAHEYFSGVLNSFKVEAERLGYDITFISENIGQTNMTFSEHCRYRHCDGVVIACVDFSAPDVQELITSNIPVVTIDHVYDNRTAILSDNIQGVSDLVHYIYSMGHRRIGYIYGDPGTSVTQKRMASFYRCCEELGIETPEEYVRPAMYHNPKLSAQATSDLLSLPEPPTCIMYPDDFSFVGGMNQIERMGLSIPDDISVAGYDGIYLSQVLRPRLTTMRQDIESLGREAAQQLVDAVENPKRFVAQHILVKAELLEGESVARIGHE